MDPESVRFMAREIHILRRLDHPNVIKLEGIVTSRMSHSLYLVFQYMEHDLAGLAAVPGIKFTESQVHDASFVFYLIWNLIMFLLRVNCTGISVILSAVIILFCLFSYIHHGFDILCRHTWYK
jgi:serine/threonine protein kinase